MTLALSTSAAFVAALGRARSISVGAYLMRPGVISRALAVAARRHAHVDVSLEAAPYDDAAGALRRQNAEVLRGLRAAGVHTRVAGAPERPFHIKAAIVDGVAYLDDCNWGAGKHETIVRDDDPNDVAVLSAVLAGAARAPAVQASELSTVKADGLQYEAELIKESPGHQFAIESESFGSGTAVYRECERRALAGDDVRVLVSAREAANSQRERHALERLAHDGASVRIGPADEKIAVAGKQSWIGSANATRGRPATIDWSLRSGDPALAAQLQQRFEENWNGARALPPP